MERRPVPPEIVEIFDDARALDDMRNAATAIAMDYGTSARKRTREAWAKIYELYPDWEWEAVGPLVFDGQTKTVYQKEEPAKELADDAPEIPDL
jgi:hypothetical protein